MRSLRTAVLPVLLLATLTGCSGNGDPGTALSDPPLPLASSTAPSPTVTAEPDQEPSREPSEEPVGPPRPTEAQLTGDGIVASDEVIAFGTTVEKARPLLEGELGKATLDTGVGSNNAAYGVCPGTKLQALEFGGGGLVVLFGDVGGPGLRMYGWALQDKGRPSAVPRASALVGDTATLEFGVGTHAAGAAGGHRDRHPRGPAAERAVPRVLHADGPVERLLRHADRHDPERHGDVRVRR